ncbi:hypothetical protein J2T17_004361 [Paenibacillus mucilaginosus]|uniref:glycoside hydrolase family 78 protein n=1 Tax=Paenibacillus mucilaginosus TaxID=61624 RepID=UPI003D255365
MHKWRSLFARTMLLVLTVQLIIPVFYIKNINAGAIEKKRFNINFQNGQLQEGSEPLGIFRSPNSTWSKAINGSDLVTGRIISVTPIVGEGQTANPINPVNNQFNIEITGKKQTVYGQAITNPGHQIYRLPNSRRWEHKGAQIPIFQFEGQTSGFPGYPGYIPEAGFIRQEGNVFADKNLTPYNGPGTPGNDLRYQNGTEPNGLNDRLKDSTWNGAAVTRSYDPSPPNNFFDGKGSGVKQVSLSDIDPGSIRLVGASPWVKKMDPFAWGYTNNPATGTLSNQIAVRRILNEVCNDDPNDCMIETANPTPVTGQLNNYVMAVNTDWEAFSYLYVGAVEITYELPAGPDLAALSLKIDKACYASGDTVKIQYEYQNIGVSTDKAFSVQIKSDATILKTDTVKGAAQGVTLKGEVDYKVASSVVKQITLVVDSGNAVDGAADRGNNTKMINLVPSDSCDPPPLGPEVVKADFNIEKTPKIPYGEDNGFQPVIEVSGGDGCSVKEVFWTATQGAKKHTWTYTQAAAVAFAGPPYPGGMGGGMVSVTMKVTTTCGTVKEAGPKSFEIYLPPGNNPPVFDAAFFDGGTTTFYPPIQQVTLGTVVDLGIVHDTTSDPNTPYDPDGDGIVYTWDFKNSPSEWLRNLAEEKDYWVHDEHFKLLKANVLGVHKVNVSAIDTRGADGGTKTVTLEVVAPNPVPVITLPPKVVEGRPFTPDISCERSYSPDARKGVKIASCTWTGKEPMYPSAGDYPITLEVTDSKGLKSLEPAQVTLPVQPDLPPIVQLDNPGYGVRNSTMYFRDTSYSPDNDPIETHTTKLACDRNNNGLNSDDPAIVVVRDANGNFSYDPVQVGKCKISIFIKEGLGYKKEAAGDFYFEVVNEAPEVDFYVQGSDFQPPEIISKSFDANTLMGSAWSVSSVGNPNKGKEYINNTAEGALETAGVAANIMSPGVSILNSNVVQSYLQWDCSHSWDYCNGLANPIKPNLFVGGQGNTWINTLSQYKDFYTPKYGVMPRGGYWNNSYSITVNYEMGRVKFVASDRHTGSSGGYNYYTFVFNISDIEASSRMDSSIEPPDPTPVYKNIEKVSFSEPNPNRPPTAPPLPYWQEPTKKGIYQIGPLPKYYQSNTNRDVPVYDNGNFSTRIYGADYAGNTYSYDCSVSGSLACDLLKSGPGGNVLWRIPQVGTTGSIYAIVPTNGFIDYLSSDNSKIVIDNKVYDNNTGALIDQIVPGTAYTAIPYYIRGYAGDKVLYTTSTVTSSNEDSEAGNLYLNTLDLRTMARNSVLVSDWSADGSDYYFGAATLDLTVTSDQKIMFAIKDSSYKIKLKIYDANLNKVTEIVNTTKAGGAAGGPYIVGDGSVVVPLRVEYDSSSYYYAWMISADAVKNDANQFNYGQFYNSSETLIDGELFARFKLNYDSYSDVTSYGLSGRMQDNRNMYRLEVSNRKSKIVKIVNGTRTVLQEVSYPIKYGAYIDVKLKMMGTRLRGYVNGVPLLDVSDSTFAISGMYGPYSETPFVFMKNFTSTAYVGNTNYTRNTAIVGQPIEYVKSYSDLENDPAIDALTKWTYNHTNPNKFLDAGDVYSGLSAFHGITVTSPHASIDKVGVYKVDYSLPDDPAPSGFKYPNPTFASYRKYSDVKSQDIIIHRRPISEFILGLNSDNTVWWSDKSRDPDRWLSSSNYSTEATGIDYAANRGVLEYKRNYTTPSGVLKVGQLTRPTESGIYTVRQAVRDEYGAWSDWYEVTIEITIPVTNAPPTVTLTYPNGTQSAPNYVGPRPTITWNQADPDPNTIFSVYDLNIKDEAGNCVRCLTNRPMDTYNGSWSWPLDMDLEMGKKYQVQVRVSDGTDWSGWSNIGWMQTNRPPAAYMTYPSGTQSSPTITNVLRPTLTWNQSDPDPSPVFQYFQIQITNEANDTMILDSGKTWQGSSSSAGSWVVTKDLPTGQKLRVRVKVWDQYGAESNWSEQTWLFINRAPVADFTWTPNPAWEGDTITLMNQSYDPDGDSFTSLWEISGPDGYSSNQSTLHGSILGSDTVNRWGSYSVKLTVTDVHGAAASVTKTIVVGELTIKGQVNHTPKWEENRQIYNANNPGSPRGIDVFFAGEQFDLVGVTTDTGASSTVAGRVQVDQVKLGWTDLEWSSDTIWNGFFNSTNSAVLPERLEDGPYDFVFTVLYTNGVMKQDVVRVYVQGKWTEFFRLHRQY